MLQLVLTTIVFIEHMEITTGDFKIFLDKKLGKGGMGEVYVGEQISLGRKVAIKILPVEFGSDKIFLERFKKEAKILAGLNDAHIVQIYGAGNYSERYYYGMELMEGKTLREVLDRNKTLSTEEIVNVSSSVAKALIAASKKGIIHRDIKPSNIFINNEGQVKVLDFGLAKSEDPNVTQSTIIAGSAKYISPEQAKGDKQDVRSDIYSLGCVMYEMSTGNSTFPNAKSITEFIYNHISVDPVPPSKINSSIPPKLEMIILKCLKKNRDDRYSSPSQLLKDLEQIKIVCEVDKTLPIEKTALVGAKSQGSKTKKFLIGSAGLAVVVVLFVVLSEGKKSNPDDKTSDGNDKKITAADSSYSDDKASVVDNNTIQPVSDVDTSATSSDGNHETNTDLPNKDIQNNGSDPDAQAGSSEVAVKDPNDAVKDVNKDNPVPASNGNDGTQISQQPTSSKDVGKDQDSAGQIIQDDAAKKKEEEARKNEEEKRLKEEKDKAENERIKKEELARQAEMKRLLNTAVELLDKREWDEAVKIINDLKKQDCKEDMSECTQILKMAADTPENMILVRGDIIEFGSDEGSDYEKPLHKRQVQHFYLDKNEVFAEDYKKFLVFIDEKGCIFKICANDEPPKYDHKPRNWGKQLEDLKKPVTGISYYDALSYSNWKQKRLPTEYEMEYVMKRDRKIDGLSNSLLEWTSDKFKLYEGNTKVIHDLYLGKAYILRGGFLYGDKKDFTKRYYAIPSEKKDESSFRCASNISTIRK